MELSIKEMMQKVENLKAGETVYIDNIPVRAGWIGFGCQLSPCTICMMKCNIFENMNTICALLDDGFSHDKRYAYLILDEEELHNCNHK